MSCRQLVDEATRRFERIRSSRRGDTEHDIRRKEQQNDSGVVKFHGQFPFADVVKATLIRRSTCVRGRVEDRQRIERVLVASQFVDRGLQGLLSRLNLARRLFQAAFRLVDLRLQSLLSLLELRLPAFERPVLLLQHLELCP